MALTVAIRGLSVSGQVQCRNEPTFFGRMELSKDNYVKEVAKISVGDPKDFSNFMAAQLTESRLITLQDTLIGRKIPDVK